MGITVVTIAELLTEKHQEAEVLNEFLGGLGGALVRKAWSLRRTARGYGERELEREGKAAYQLWQQFAGRAGKASTINNIEQWLKNSQHIGNGNNDLFKLIASATKELFVEKNPATVRRIPKTTKLEDYEMDRMEVLNYMVALRRTLAAYEADLSAEDEHKIVTQAKIDAQQQQKSPLVSSPQKPTTIKPQSMRQNPTTTQTPNVRGNTQSNAPWWRTTQQKPTAPAVQYKVVPPSPPQSSTPPVKPVVRVAAGSRPIQPSAPSASTK
jgi:hypothetical protein